MSQPFILNDERLMGQSNHRMPVAAEKGVEGRTASPLIFLSRVRSEGGRFGFDEERSLPTKQGFQQRKKRGDFSALTQR